MKIIELEHQKNVRDLGGMVGFGGKKVKYGRIFRGGHLNQVSNDDILLINSLRLTDVIDFRSKVEFNNRPDYRFMGVTYHSLPAMKEEVQEGLREKYQNADSNLLWFLGDGMSGIEHMTMIYSNIMSSQEGISAYKEFFRILTSDENRIVYYHCSQGKDRAGIASYLLEIALGVSEEEARADYLFSNEAMNQKISYFKVKLKDEPFYSNEYETDLEGVFSAKIEYLESSIKVMEHASGSVMNYIKNILEVDVSKLRKIYLE